MKSYPENSKLVVGGADIPLALDAAGETPAGQPPGRRRYLEMCSSQRPARDKPPIFRK
jgi:hypothetical protein